MRREWRSPVRGRAGSCESGTGRGAAEVRGMRVQFPRAQGGAGRIPAGPASQSVRCSTKVVKRGVRGGVLA